MTLLPGWWRRRFLIIEFGVSIIVAGAFFAWYVQFGGAAFVEAFLKGHRAPIYGTLATIFGTLLGFGITATSIVVGFSGSEQLRLVRESRHYGTIWKVFSSTIRALGLATIVALLALIFDRDAEPIPVLMFALVFVSALSLLRVFRTVWILENVIDIVSKQ